MLLVHSVNAAATAYEVRPVFEHHRAERPVFAFDLPGFGLSQRGPRPYTPRLMTDAVLAVAAEARRRHGGARIDALGLSLGSEFVARAVVERPDWFRSLTLVSPTGFNGRKRFHGPPGSTREVGLARALLVGDGLGEPVGATGPVAPGEVDVGQHLEDVALLDHPHERALIIDSGRGQLGENRRLPQHRPSGAHHYYHVVGDHRSVSGADHLDQSRQSIGARREEAVGILVWIDEHGLHA